MRWMMLVALAALAACVEVRPVANLFPPADVAESANSDAGGGGSQQQ